jgi:hypothetical protein
MFRDSGRPKWMRTCRQQHLKDDKQTLARLARKIPYNCVENGHGDNYSIDFVSRIDGDPV